MPSASGHDSHADQVEIARAIREAHYGNRQIVPILGAGISAESGFPVIRSIIRYLAKLQAVIGHSTHDLADLKAKIDERYDDPSRYVTDFGWPDRFTLNQDLFQLGRDKTITEQVITQLDDLAKLICPANWNFDELQKTVGKLLTLPPDLDETFKARDNQSVRWDLIGDWRRLIQHFTGYQNDLADSLLTTLGREKAPNQGHRYLAFLIRRLSIRTVFTFNFDDLIEKALEIERYRPKVFSMEQGRDLPHRSLIDEVVSIIKMHGSTHSLLLDERLDRPLDKAYLGRFDELTGADPLLLVVGCSGGDYRLHSLVRHTLEKNDKRKIGPRVAWLRWEGDVPAMMRKDVREKASGVHPAGLCAQTRNVPSALTHLYSYLSSRYPASRRPYQSNPDRPSRYPVEEGRRPYLEHKDLDEVFKAGGQFRWVSSVELKKIDDPPAASNAYARVTASEVLFDVAAKGQALGYNTITVNLEAMHSLAAVVGSIIDQCRQYDSALVPSVLPAEEPEDDAGRTELVARAVSIVVNALQRSRYVVLLDGLEAYLWSSLSHHGETTLDPGRQKRFELLCEFFTVLKKRRTGLAESRVVLGIDQRELRNAATDQSNPTTFKDELVAALNAEDRIAYAPREDIDLDRFYPAACIGLGHKTVRPDYARTLTLALLCASRRPRPLAQVRHLLRPIHKTYPRIDEEIDKLLNQGFFRLEGRASWVRHPEGFERLEAAADWVSPPTGFLRLEGGALWISRPVRDMIYARLTSACTTSRFESLFEGRATDEETVDTVVQLVVICGVHHRLSRTYYVYTFGQSHDSLAFLEYTYHRIAGLRYLTKLVALLRRAHETGRGVLIGDAFARAQRVLKDAVGFTAAADPVGEDAYKNLCLRFQFREGTELERALNSAPDAARKFEPDRIPKLVEELQSRHRRETHAVNRVWQRHEPHLRLQLPAQHLLQWCGQLVGDDLRYRCDHVVIGYNPHDPDSPTKRATPGVPVVHDDQIQALMETLKNLQVKIWTERGDYLKVLALRCNQLRLLKVGDQDTLATVIGRLQPDRWTPARDTKTGITRIDSFHFAIDMVNALIKYAHGRPLPSDDGLAKAKALLGGVLEHLGPRGDEEPTGLHEARMRCHFLLAEAEWTAASVFGDRAELDRLIKDPPDAAHRDRLKKIITAIDGGMEENRYQLHAGGDSPRSVVVDRVSDGSLYSQYRTAFDALRARAQWQDDLLRFREHRAWNPTSRTRLSEYLESAFRYFELARSGQEDTNPLLGALAEIYMAEACLAAARFLRGPANAGGFTRVEVLAEARAKLESARGCLQRAARQLQSARRNVVWWRLYLTIVAQYQAEQLAALLAGRDPIERATVDPEQPDSRNYPEYLRRLRKGYNAVCNAARFHTEPARPDSWLARIAKDITVTGFRLIARSYRWYATDSGTHDRANPEVAAAAHGLADAILRRFHQWERLDDEHAIGDSFRYADLAAGSAAVVDHELAGA